MGPLKLLVVDDSPAMRKALVETLRTVPGCRIVGEGANGLEALELAWTHHPDLIVMDIHMPLMGGLEAMTILKREFRGTRIVLVSSALEPEVRDAALKGGADACLQKGEQLGHQLPAIVSQLCHDLADRPANTQDGST